MKKLVAFAMVLCLGLFCASGCNKPTTKTDKDKTAPTTTAPVTPDKGDKAADKAAPAPEKPADKAPAAPEKK